MSMGSGVLYKIGNGVAWVVTNNHVVKDARGPTTVVFSNGKSYGATIGGRDPQSDLAWLKIFDPGVQPMVLAETEPNMNEQLWIAGLGPNGRFVYQTGRLSRYVSTVRDTANMMEISGCQARQGDSGGPIINAQGKLVGVLNSAGRGFTVGCRLGPLRRFLGLVLGRTPPQGSPITIGNPPQTQPPPGQSTGPNPKQMATLQSTVADILAQLAIMQKQADEPKQDETQNQAALPTQDKPPSNSGANKIKDAVGAAAGIGGLAASKAGIDWGLALAGAAVGGPAGVALMSAGRIAYRSIKRRRNAKRDTTTQPGSGGSADGFPQGPARYRNEAIELLRLSQLEGRSPVHDALVGRLAYDELDAEIQKQGPGADFARLMRRRLEDKFNDIAPLSQTPA